MTTFAKYVEENKIPQLAENTEYEIVGVNFDQIDYQQQKLDRAIFDLANQTQVSGLGQAILNQAKRFSDYFDSVKDAEPIKVLAIKQKAKEKGKNPYWVFVDPTTKKAL